MSEILPTAARRMPLAALAAAALAACGADLTLPPAQIPIAQQQITLYALTGTPVNTSSAYSMLGLAEVRTDLSTSFDFAFDIRDTLGGTQAYLLPRGSIGFVPDGGLQLTSLPFDSVVRAPNEGYVRDRPVPIDSGTVLIAASRAQTCSFSIVLPRYAKLLVLSLDRVNRVVVIRVVIDPNCGYRGLGSGIPTE